MITPRSGGFPFKFRKETDRRKPSVVSIHHSANHQEAGKHNGNYKKEIKVFQIIFFFHRMDWRPPGSSFVPLFADRWLVTTPTSQRDFWKLFLWESVHLRLFWPRPPIFTLALPRPVGKMLRPVHPWFYPFYPTYTFTLKLLALSMMIYHVAPLWKTSITNHLRWHDRGTDRGSKWWILSVRRSSRRVAWLVT